MAETIFKQREIRVARDLLCDRHLRRREAVFAIYNPAVARIVKTIQRCDCISYFHDVSKGNAVYMVEEFVKDIFPALMKVKPGTTKAIKYISAEV